MNPNCDLRRFQNSAQLEVTNVLGIPYSLRWIILENVIQDPCDPDVSIGLEKWDILWWPCYSQCDEPQMFYVIRHYLRNQNWTVWTLQNVEEYRCFWDGAQFVPSIGNTCWLSDLDFTMLEYLDDAFLQLTGQRLRTLVEPVECPGLRTRGESGYCDCENPIDNWPCCCTEPENCPEGTTPIDCDCIPNEDITFEREYLDSDTVFLTVGSEGYVRENGSYTTPPFASCGPIRSWNITSGDIPELNLKQTGRYTRYNQDGDAFADFSRGTLTQNDAILMPTNDSIESYNVEAGTLSTYDRQDLVRLCIVDSTGSTPIATLRPEPLLMPRPIFEKPPRGLWRASVRIKFGSKLPIAGGFKITFFDRTFTSEPVCTDDPQGFAALYIQTITAIGWTSQKMGPFEYTVERIGDC